MASHLQDKSDPKWTVIQRGAWAGRVSKDLRRSPVTTQEICETTVHGSVETVVNFWKALGFEISYDVIKEGNQCRCHEGGFGVDIIWSVVHPNPCRACHTRAGVFRVHVASKAPLSNEL